MIRLETTEFACTDTARAIRLALCPPRAPRQGQNDRPVPQLGGKGNAPDPDRDPQRWTRRAWVRHLFEVVEGGSAIRPRTNRRGHGQPGHRPARVPGELGPENDIQLYI